MMQLSQAARMLDARLTGEDVLFSSVSKDTRSIKQGDLYVALKGARFDGHDFVAEAIAAGAVAAMVSEPVKYDLPCIQVADTRLALGALAAAWRDQFKGKVIGVTGSNGKTTVKEMCRSILVQHVGESHVLSTQGNLNNDIGMPLTILSLREQHKFAVIEMGANHVGEIDYLTHIARPDVAGVNNVGSAHIEGFGSLENIAHAKAEIYSGLGKHGVAVINQDDRFASLWLDICKHKNCRTFSLQNNRSNVFASELYAGVDHFDFRLHVGAESIKVKLSLPGVHNVMNALAASALCSALGVDLKTIAQALKNFSTVRGRLNIRKAIKGARLIDDTYNANPQSFAAAMEVLVEMAGTPWVVMGDMAELGDSARELHRALGQQAKQLGVKRLYATGVLSREAVRGFGVDARWFADHAMLIDALKSDVGGDIVMLVKGSRFMAMEKVAEALSTKVMQEESGARDSIKSRRVN